MLSSKKKPRVGLSDYAEYFQLGLNFSKKEYQMRVRIKFCLRCGKKGHFVGDCEVAPLLAWEKASRVKNLELDLADSKNKVLTVCVLKMRLRHFGRTVKRWWIAPTMVLKLQESQPSCWPSYCSLLCSSRPLLNVVCLFQSLSRTLIQIC